MTKQTQPTLPSGGLSRWRQLKAFIPFSYETFRKMVNAGKAPAKITNGIRCTYWRNDEIIEFLKDIPGYRASRKDKTPSTARTGG